MFKRITQLSWLLVAFLGLSLALAACGDSPTATTNNPNSNPAALQVPTGVKSTLAGNFPDSTVLYMTFNTDGNSSQAKGWQKMLDYLNQIPEIKNVTQNADVLSLAKLGTYEGDIKPWLGNELAIGVTDLKPIVELANSMTSTSSSSAATPNLSEIPLLIGASITDQTKADAFVNKLAIVLKQAGVPEPKKETYKDATLYTFTYLVNIVVGISKDKLFIGGGTNLVKGAFDQAADKSLNAASGYKTVTGKLPAANLAFFYFDYPSVSKSLSGLAQAKEILESMKSMQLDYTGPVGATFSVADEGLRMDTYSVYLPEKTPTAMADILKKGANPNKILNAIPENTLAFGNSRDAASSYDMMINVFKTSMSNPALKSGSATSVDIDKTLADFEKQTGLNVRNDIVGLFSGEFAVFVTPSATSKTFPIGLGLVAEATDKAASQTKLDKIEKAIETAAKGEVKWESKTVGSTTFKSAAVKDASVQTSINLGIANGYSFLTLGDDTTTNFIGAATGGKNITNGANSASFNKVRDALSKDNVGYVYADIQAIINYALQFAPADEASKVKNVTDKLTKLYALGGTTRQNPTEAASTFYIYFPVTK